MAHSVGSIQMCYNWFQTKRVVIPEPRKVPEASHRVTVAKENVILVVDTNIFIHELDFIKNIMNSHIEGL